MFRTVPPAARPQPSAASAGQDDHVHECGSSVLAGIWHPERAMTRQLKLGIAGIGVGASEMLPAMEDMAEIDLMAGADVVPQTLERFKGRYPNVRTFDSVAKMCDDPDV